MPRFCLLLILAVALLFPVSARADEPEDECGPIDFVGCCDGTSQVFCEEKVLVVVDCAGQGLVCGWKESLGWYDCVLKQSADPSGEHHLWCPDTCEPLCEGKECGPDGCGGVCGSCTGGESCQNGQCKPLCEPQCEGRSCGDDGCGDLCGECEPGLVCEAGLCIDSCIPQCEGKECGDNGCGGSCGKCAPGMSCADFLCVLQKDEEPDVVSPPVVEKDFVSPEASDGACAAAGEPVRTAGLPLVLLLLVLGAIRRTSRA